MATAINLITKALYLNGCSSEINPASPELTWLTFEALVDMLVDWDAQNIALGATIPTSLTDELSNPPDTNQCIQYNLAEISAPLFQKVAPAVVTDRASKLFSDMMTNYSVTPVACLPETLPRGSGNAQADDGRRFYGYSDCLTDVNGIPLLGGAGS